VSYGQVFWQSRVSAAFRTGCACLMVGMIVHHYSTPFPVFAYIMAVSVVGEASLGEALRSTFSVLVATLHGVCPTIPVLLLIKPLRFSLWVTTACVTVSCFYIAYPKVTNITSKRAAFAQIVIIYVSAFMKRESMDAITYPLSIAGTTGIGTGCALLALILPVPRLAHHQVISLLSLNHLVIDEISHDCRAPNRDYSSISM
jgi:hypothetical protein